MNRNTFLNHHDVRDFICWVNHITRGEWRLRKCTDQGVFASHDSIMLYDAYKKYEWNGANFEKACEPLDEYQLRIRSIVNECPASAKDKREFLQVAKSMLKWGGINLPKLDKLENKALEELTKCARRLEPATATLESLSGFKYMGSGFSKIYSLMLDDFPIYDSRVACALTSLICLFCVDTGLPRVPEILKLGVPSDRSSKVRNPSRGAYIIPNIRGSQYTLHAKSNLKAAWILKQLADNTDCGPFSMVPENRKVRALEASLFMIGEESLDDDSVIKA